MRIVVLGGGESGYGSAVLAKIKGFDVFLSDMGAIDPRYTAILDRYGVPYEQGGHSPEHIYNADMVIKSPGIPETAPIMRELRLRMMPVISEIEFAGKYAKGKKICVTGANGKTTTTTLIYTILKNAGYNAAVGGNIGESFAYTVATRNVNWHVLELSSFQLDDTYYFKPDIAVITNITPDHLDRYDHDFQKYVDAKFKVIRNQKHNDFFVFWSDDPVIQMEIFRREPVMTWLPFSSEEKEAQGAFLDGNGIVTANVCNRHLSFDTAQMKLKGLHNAYNAMAAALAAMAAGVDNDVIVNTIYDFNGVEHRMEYVACKGGIEYINDSKATNVDSTWYALECMKRPTVWIAGGTDKGNDYKPLAELAREKVKALVCMGVDNSKLVESFTEVVPAIYDTHSLGEAMEAVRNASAEGDTVLLSPACASFDLFKNYEDRGRRFKEAVKEIR